MKNPFRCRGCDAKDEELKFLRGQFASMRSMTKEPQQEMIGPSGPGDYWIPNNGPNAGIPQSWPRPNGTPAHAPDEPSQAWARNPIEESEMPLHSPERDK